MFSVARILQHMATNKIRNLRWWIILLIMLGAMVNYLTRSSLGVAAPTLLKDLKITSRDQKG